MHRSTRGVSPPRLVHSCFSRASRHVGVQRSLAMRGTARLSRACVPASAPAHCASSYLSVEHGGLHRPGEYVKGRVQEAETAGKLLPAGVFTAILQYTLVQLPLGFPRSLTSSERLEVVSCSQPPLGKRRLGAAGAEGWQPASLHLLNSCAATLSAKS